MNEHERDLTDASTGAERTPEEIEREIERTRERMSSNIDALGEKLSPDALKQQAKDAITGKAQDVVANVGDQARETGSRVLDFITQNPLPVAAVTLGAIWFFALRSRDQGEVSGDRMARFAYTGPERREPNGRPSLGRRITDRLGSVKDTVKEKVSGAASSTGERASELKEEVQERAGELGSATAERAREMRGGFERMMQENPLALALGAVVVGVALGMLLPETEKERQVLGPARDQLADRVQQTASRVKDVAADAAREVQETVREEVAYRGPELKSTLKDAAATVGQQVKESAGRVAQEAKDQVRQNPSQGGTG